MSSYDRKTVSELHGLEDMQLMDEYILARRMNQTYNGIPMFDAIINPYRTYCTQIESEFYSRGYTSDALTADADLRQQMIEESDFGDLTSEAAVNYRFLADVNGAREELIYRYMNLSVSEREITPRFKTELPERTFGTAAGSRWDMTAAGQATMLNEGLATQCQITQNADGTYHCSSDYLGTFDYDPTEWAIGYKTVPGTENENADGSLTRLPVFCYVGGLEADAGHADGFEEGLNLNPFGNGGWSGTNRNEQVHIPEGVRVLDYTFDGNTELQLIPALPDSVVSAHCCFRNCSRLHGASKQFKTGEDLFNSGGQWGWPSGLCDLSSMFSGCSELGNTYIGSFPSSALTINGIFDGCSQLFDENHDFITGLFANDGYLEADYSDCPFLMEEFADAYDADTSDNFKRNAEREFEELMATQSAIDWSQQSEEIQVGHEDAASANTAVRTEHILQADDRVRDIDEVSYDAPDGNETWVLLQRGAIDVGSFMLLKGATGLVTDSKLAGWIVGLGGTALLRGLDVLPSSFEPILQMVKPILPDGAQQWIDGVCDKLHVPSVEEYAAARQDQLERYVPLALNDSLYSGVHSVGGVTTESLREAMRVNGQSVGMTDVFLQAGRDGRHTVGSVGQIVSGSVAAAEDVFDTYATNGTPDVDLMRKYYMDLFEGLDAYNSGAQSGIASHYTRGSNEYQIAMRGLSYVNGEYCDVAMASLRAYDAQYHFMRDEDWLRLESMNIYGVDSLMNYQPGQALLVAGQTLQNAGSSVPAPLVQNQSIVEHESVDQIRARRLSQAHETLGLPNGSDYESGTDYLVNV